MLEAMDGFAGPMTGGRKKQGWCLLVSIAVHLAVLAFLLASSLAVQNRPLEVVMVDFSQALGPRSVGSDPKVEAKPAQLKQGIGRSEETSPAPEAPARRDEKALAAAQATESLAPLPGQSVVAAPEPRSAVSGRSAAAASPRALPNEGASLRAPEGSGPVAVPTERPSALPGNRLDPGGSVASPGGRERGKAQAEGSWAEGGEDYNFLRDEILKRIRYPDRARRLGLEGRVLLAFVVLENGTIGEIQVLQSSDYRLLDEAAKEAVAGTRLTEPLPYRVNVRLPITYRLQGAGCL